MDFFILPKAIIFLFLTMNAPTTLVFQNPVEYVSAGKTGDFSINRSNNKKILVIQPLKEVSETNMVVVTSEENFNFKVQIVDKEAHSFVYLYDGQVNKSFIKKLETDSFRILEGETSVLIQNKEKHSLTVNGVSLEREGYFSKGSPVMIENKRVLY